VLTVKDMGLTNTCFTTRVLFAGDALARGEEYMASGSYIDPLIVRRGLEVQNYLTWFSLKGATQRMRLRAPGFMLQSLSELRGARVAELYPFCPAPPKKGRVMERRAILLVPATMAVVLVVAVCAVALLVVPQKAEANYPGKPGKIAYAGFDGHDDEIYTINPDGVGKVRVTKNATRDYAPAWESRP
jgi:hypothetical protein